MDLEPMWDWFRALHATSGIKLTIFYDAFDRARFLNGFLTSIRLMGVCLVLSVAIVVVLNQDGQTNWFEGALLLALYAILAIAFFYIPTGASGH